ncbi:MAG: phospholipase D-like domain-containing protein [Halopseudomonas sp.]
MKGKLVRRVKHAAFGRQQQGAWHPGNRVQLLVDGDCYFEAMFGAIACAQQRVLLEFYQVSSGGVVDRLIEVLLGARQRQVEVYFVLDGFGSRLFSQTDRQRLELAGVRFAVYNPIRVSKLNRNFARDHRKLLAVDGTTAFVGGSGLADEFIDSDDGQPAWHELMLQVGGPVVAEWERLFARVWRWCTAESLVFPKAKWAAPPAQALMKIATSEGPQQQEIKINFRRRIEASEQRVWLVTAYFLPSWSIRRALRKAARRGVDVRLLLPGPQTDHPAIFYASQRYYYRLLKAGVRIFEYSPRFNHAKVCLSDHWASLGSCNLDHWNLRWNLEANQEVIDAGFIDHLLRQLEHDFNQSKAISLNDWQARPLLQRAYQFSIGYICAILLRVL